MMAIFTAAMAFLLIIAGGIVTSTDSGLSVPDWPLSYGRLFPPMVGGIRFEHSHRMIAAFVGLLTLILALWLLKKESRMRVRWLGIFAFGLVVLQGILGGLTVIWQLPVPISVAHACLGPTFFALLVVLATVLRPTWKREAALRPEACGLGLAILSLLTTGAIYGQLILGAILRHTGVGLGYHLTAAVSVTFLVALLVAARRKSRLAWTLAGLILLQLTLGAFTFFTGNSALFATAHVAGGALSLAASLVLTVRIFRYGLSPLKRLWVYLELTKPRLTGLAVLTSLVGFLLGSTAPLDLGRLFVSVLGTALVGAGAGALNQLLERESDSKMQRTKKRPLPSERLSPESALAFGVLCSVAGLLTLSLGAGPLAGSLASITLGIYLFVYTPLKRRTALCTLVGAIPGAIPPLIGWAAVRGGLGLEAWLLFAILFLWQLPHFLAIAWVHRDDYREAGLKMLPVLDPKGGLTFRQIALYSLALIPVSLLPSALGIAGWVYFLGAFMTSVAFSALGLATALGPHSGQAAHRLFLASLLYLPSILITMTLDRVIL